MTHVLVPTHEGRGPRGYSYDGVLVRADRGALLRVLRELQVSGWLGPQEGDWVVLVVAAAVDRPISRARPVDELAREVARRLHVVALAVSCRLDRALGLAAWTSGDEVGRYASRPSATGLAVSTPEQDDLAEADVQDDQRLADLAALGDPVALAALSGSPVDRDGPVGAQLGAQLAVSLDRDEVAEEVESALAAQLDDEEIESERLTTVLDLLRLPRWLVAAPSLPRDVPGGPKSYEFTRLGSSRRLPGLRLPSLPRRRR